MAVNELTRSVAKVGALIFGLGTASAPRVKLTSRHGVPTFGPGDKNNDWCVSDNGHIYHAEGGAWVQKV